MSYKFCPKCGRELTAKDCGDDGPTPHCQPCGTAYFNSARPCVLVTVVNDRCQAALLRQHYISDTHWVQVAGYIAQGETAEQAAAREVREETGLEPQSVRYVASYYQDARDLLIFGFLARVPAGEFAPSAEVDDIAWFPLDEAPGMLRDGSTGWKLIRDARPFIGRPPIERQ